MPDLPRILFLANEPPSTEGAGGIIFQRLFCDWPADRLLVVTNASLPKEGRLACRYEAVKLAADRLNRTRFWSWRAVLRALGGADIVSLRCIRKKVRDFRPDGIVTLMQDGWFYDVAARYARQAKIPLALFVHDLPQGFAPVAPWLRPWQRRRDERVYRQAQVRFCVSAPMEEWFRTEFATVGEVLPPPHSELPVSQAPHLCRALKTPDRLTLGYAGGLHYGYGEQLLAMLPVLRESGTRVEMCGPRPTGQLAPLLAATDVFHFHGRLPPEDAWRLILSRCDVVLQPYLNPAGEHAMQYRTHFPSKLGDCLSLGLPLLVTGSVEASGQAWCLAQPGAALCLTDPAPAALREALARLRDDPAWRESLAERALAVAGEFAPGPLRERMARRLSEIFPLRRS